MERTIVAAGHAAASLAVVGDAGVLLQVRVGNAAGAEGHWTALVLASRDRVVLRKGRGDGGNAEEDGGERELHLDGQRCWC